MGPITVTRCKGHSRYVSPCQAHGREWDRVCEARQTMGEEVRSDKAGEGGGGGPCAPRLFPVLDGLQP